MLKMTRLNSRCRDHFSKSTTDESPRKWRNATINEIRPSDQEILFPARINIFNKDTIADKIKIEIRVSSSES